MGRRASHENGFRADPEGTDRAGDIGVQKRTAKVKTDTGVHEGAGTELRPRGSTRAPALI